MANPEEFEAMADEPRRYSTCLIRSLSVLVAIAAFATFARGAEPPPRFKAEQHARLLALGFTPRGAAVAMRVMTARRALEKRTARAVDTVKSRASAALLPLYARVDKRYTRDKHD